MLWFPLRRLLWLVILCLTIVSFSTAQAGPPSAGNEPPSPATQASGGEVAGRLVIGAGDEGDVSVDGKPEMTQHVRVSSGGDISLPLIGRVVIAGLTSEGAQALIEKKLLDGGFLTNPHVTLLIKEYSSHTITVIGEVNKPGTYSALAVHRLCDLFTTAGGLTQRAGSTVTIGHRGQGEEPEVITLSSDPVISSQHNVELRLGDTVVVSRVAVVYVLGEVVKPGGFVMEGQPEVGATDVLAMAGGPTRLAVLEKVTLIRKYEKGIENRTIDLKKIFAAKAADIPLRADDIIFVPSTRGKAAERSTNSILSMIGGLALYRF
jgi:polysaccharide biosynthesis/export protein